MTGKKKVTPAQMRMLGDVAADRISRTRTPDGWRWRIGDGGATRKEIDVINALFDARLITPESYGTPGNRDSQRLHLTPAGQDQLGGFS